MTTEVIMKRNFNGSEISQKSKSGFLSATDLIKIANKWRADNGKSPFDLTEYLRLKSTKEFTGELEAKYGKIKISGSGRNSHTWVHPLLFIDIALTVNPKFKVEMYQWLYDNLLKYRNDSGDSYKKMAGALYLKINNKTEYKELVIDVAREIKKECNVESWEMATEAQLKLRDKMHDNISLLADVLPIKEAVRLGIHKAKNYMY